MHSHLVCSLAAFIALTSSSASGNGAAAPVASGSASAAWSITQTGHVVTCAHAGATSVSLLLHSRASGFDTASSFACVNGQGTLSVPTGTYDVRLSLRAADGATLATAPLQAGVTIAAGRVTALRP